jgi:hypothetical protein
MLVVEQHSSSRVRIPFCSSHTFPQYLNHPTSWIEFLQSFIKRVVINNQDGSQILCRRKLQDVRRPNFGSRGNGIPPAQIFRLGDTKFAVAPDV